MKITHPGKWTHGLVHLLEPLTRLIIFSLQLLASVEISVILPAILGLICVRESSVKGGSGVVLQSCLYVVITHGAIDVSETVKKQEYTFKGSILTWCIPTNA